MPSPRTDPRDWLSAWRSVDPNSLASLADRLNVRLILALGVVALVGLVVSGAALSQILPGFFAEQSRERTETAARSARIFLGLSITSVGEAQPDVVMDPQLRDELVVAPIAAATAEVFDATVAIINSQNELVAIAEPPDREALEAAGLRRDTEVDPVGRSFEVPLPGGSRTTYQVIVSEPYSAREQTLSRIREALIGAGLLALLVSVLTGIVAARTVTRPVRRLRGVASRIAQGELDERVPPSGVLEIDELGRQFNVMADRLAGTLRMLEADRDRLREFVADVSHELRTPIAALRMYNELLREGKVEEETRAEFLDRSNEQVHRLEWLSTNLLDLSRIDAGIFPLDMRVGDLRDPIQAVVQALSEVAIERGIELDSETPGHPVELRFDRERIVQLLTNLLGNALKFTPRGGSVSVRLTETDSAAEIEVRDSGAGIPIDELPRIFERFYRGTNTGDARASGSGLGLAIVRSIVDMHGGEIDVASVVGDGTVFRIRLPRELTPESSGDGKVNDSSLREHRAPTVTI
ncbi:MAG: ATP-binding protein [Candidatus Limnocylindria bacterium]